jgi:type IV secretion system protein VirB6
MNAFAYILSLVDAATATYILDVFSRIATAANPVFRNLMILYFILYGIGIWRGVIKAEFKELFFNIIKASVVYAFVFTWTIYSPIIVDFLTNGPDALAGTIAGTATGNITDIVGAAYERSLEAAEKAYSKSGWVMPAILGTVIWVASTIVVSFAVALICIAKIALSILLGMGGLAFLMILFKGTHKMFEAWMQQCINFFLYIVITISVLMLMGGMYRNVIYHIPNDPSLIDLGTVVPLVLIAVVIMLILKQVPALASAIAGGVQISSLGAEGAPGHFARRLLRYRNLKRGGRGLRSIGRGLRGLMRRGNSASNG